MTDRERHLEARVAYNEYGSHSLNQMLSRHNSALILDDGKGRDTLVCTCHKCLGLRRFGTASPAGIYKTFGTGGHDGKCIVKKCLKYQCAKAGLACIECDAHGSRVAGDIRIVSRCTGGVP